MVYTKKRGHNKINALFCLTFFIWNKTLNLWRLIEQRTLIFLHIELDISVSVGYFWVKCLDATWLYNK